LRTSGIMQRMFIGFVIVALPFSLVVPSCLVEVPEVKPCDYGVAVLDSESIVSPVVRRRSGVDRDFDGVQDSLEKVLSEVAVNESAVIPVIITLYNRVTDEDLNYFRMLGGVVSHVYEYVAYGFAGVIPAIHIRKFVNIEKGNVFVIERDQPIRYHLDVSVPLVRVRPIVWEYYGYMGSSTESIAILDTGIDDSHPDVGPFGDLNFSRKIVGWYDATGDGALAPEDYGEHGTHVAAIAAGSGASNHLQGSGVLATTFTYVLPPSGYGYLDYIDVRSPGVIRLDASWDGNNKVLLRLYDPAEGVVDEISSRVPPIVMTYNTTGTYYSAGRYRVLMANMAGASGNAFSVVETYPYTGLNDGYGLFGGVAPNSRLVGVKVFDNRGSGTLSGLLAGMDWVVQNRVRYRIVVASMSLGLEKGAVDSTLDQKADAMVNYGIVTTVSAGNDFPDYSISSPGTAAYVITVAASNDVNGITEYSSNGDSSKNEFGLIKPDVAAPGGTFQPEYGNQIMSVDSNDVDGEYTGYADRNLNDYQQMAGTSMSAPHVAGLAALVIQALGSWNWTQAEALKVKMIIGMTASETRSGETTRSGESNQPPLNRGGKDGKEGYGVVSGDAAIEAVKATYVLGETATDSLGSAPSSKKVWARRVALEAGNECEFRLFVPTGADYDLYLYDGSPDGYGQPIVLRKSVNASLGGLEALKFAPAASGVYYVVVKWVSGSGVFTLRGGTGKHDVAVVNVVASSAEVYVGGLLNVSVALENQGVMNASFGVSVYYGTVVIGMRNVTDLAVGAVVNLTFGWRVSQGELGFNYAIRVEASAVLDEVDIGDNIRVGGAVFVKMVGDVNGDRLVNIDDLVMVARALATDSSWPSGTGWNQWNPKCDMNYDGVVDVFDLAASGVNYGRTY